MRRLRIKDKRQFKKAILVFIMTISMITGIILYCNYLKVNGLSSLFTTNVYKEAFEVTTKSDTAIINLLMGFSIGSVVVTAINLLLEHESEEQEDYALNQILKRNGVRGWLKH